MPGGQGRHDRRGRRAAGDVPAGGALHRGTLAGSGVPAADPPRRALPIPDRSRHRSTQAPASPRCRTAAFGARAIAGRCPGAAAAPSDPPAGFLSSSPAAVVWPDLSGGGWLAADARPSGPRAVSAGRMPIITAPFQKCQAGAAAGSCGAAGERRRCRVAGAPRGVPQHRARGDAPRPWYHWPVSWAAVKAAPVLARKHLVGGGTVMPPAADARADGADPPSNSGRAPGSQGRSPGDRLTANVSGVWPGGRVSVHAWPGDRRAVFRCCLAAVGGTAAMVAV